LAKRRIYRTASDKKKIMTAPHRTASTPLPHRTAPHLIRKKSRPHRTAPHQEADAYAACAV